MISLGLNSPEQTYQSGDHALIIGAGLAGCAAAYVLAQQGFHCKVFESTSAAANATSGLPVATYRPYLSIGQNVVNDYFCSAFERIVTELKQSNPSIHQQRGLLQLIEKTDKWQAGKHWTVETKASASEVANNFVKKPALHIKQAGALKPACLCARWIQSSCRIELFTNSPISAIKKTTDGWLVKNNAHTTIGEGQLIVLANGNGVNHLIGQHQFPLTPVRGQISHFTTDRKPPPTTPLLAAKGYAIPTDSGFWAGATHQRNSNCDSITATDDQCNLATLNAIIPGYNPELSAKKSWTGIRCTTPDRLPLVGGIPDAHFYNAAYQDLHHGRKEQSFPSGASLPGLYVLTGFGSRGATQALYAADCLAGVITGTPTAEQSILSAIHPARFLMRQLRKRPTTTR